MNLSWPDRFLQGDRLWVLALVAVLGAAYVALQLRRRRYQVRFTNVALLDVVAPKRPGWRRHLPAAALLAALVALVVAVAQPIDAVRVPRERATVVLAIDTSLSMEATDVAPSRLEAAQQAAREFVDELPDAINLGLVAFAGTARVLVTPSTDRDAAARAIDSLALAEGTAIGEAIFTALDAIAQVPPPEDGEEPVPARIVVMSDGSTTVGRPNSQGAAAAAEAGVPVSTIAFGTPTGEIVVEQTPVLVPVEPAPLSDIASTTGGAFFEASSLSELEDVYDDIGSAVGYETKDEEVTVRFAAFGLVLALVAAALSMVWSNRLV